MTFDEMVKECIEDSERWFPAIQNDFHRAMVHHALGLGGEVGEFQNLLKKVDRDSMSFAEALPMLRDELTDVIIYVANLVGLLEMNVAEEYKRKQAENDVRFSSR